MKDRLKQVGGSRYSWVICGVCVLLMLCNSGMPANILPVYLPFLEDLGYSGAQSSALITIRCMFGLVGVLVVAKFYEKISLRVGLTFCSALVCLAFFIMSGAKSYGTYVVGAALLGISYGLGAIVPVSLLISRWFVRRKATAISICAAGTGVSAMVLPPLLTRIAETYSLKTAFYFTGSLALLILVLAVLVIRNDPAQMGLVPYGAGWEQESKAAKVSPADRQRGDLPAMARYSFLAAMVLFGGISMGSYSHYSVLFTTGGHSKAAAALCCSIQGGVLIFSKCLYGVMADRFGGRRSSLLFLAILTVGCGACSLSAGSVFFMYLGSVLMAIGLPPASVGISVWAEEFSTEKTYASVLRSYQLAYTCGGMLMSSLPGWIYDLSGSYTPAYTLFTVLFGAFVVVVALIYRCSRRSLAGS